MREDTKIAVIGLGYVGLPLALAFGKTYNTVGYDVSESRIENYKKSIALEGEASKEEFEQAKRCTFSADPEAMKGADIFLVAVPTPVDAAKQPNLSPLAMASRDVGQNLKKGSIVIYESTVYPGVTEDFCGPILEGESGLTCGVDFKLGYSPERINPGDPSHGLRSVTKVISAQDAETLKVVEELYKLVVTEADVYPAATIKTAEAAKVIENAQRDLNIAFVNELSIIFNKMGLDTIDVLEAAGTKWNFLPFRPGLVGGHCIGVDPYYLTHKAELLGYHPEVILAGRRINDNMGKFIAEQTVKEMIKSGHPIKGARVLIMGLTFKENCADLRNSRVIDLIDELKTYGAYPKVWDPVADPGEARRIYGVQLCELDDVEYVNAIVSAVPHKEVLGVDLGKLKEKSGDGVPFIDVKSSFSRAALKEAGFKVWRL